MTIFWKIFLETTKHNILVFNPFQTNVLFLYPLKAYRFQMFSGGIERVVMTEIIQRYSQGKYLKSKRHASLNKHKL